MTRLVLFELFVTNLQVFEHQQNKTKNKQTKNNNNNNNKKQTKKLLVS